MSALIENIEIICPYCGQSIEADVDCTVADQTYYEDCQVCCAPVKFCVKIDESGNLIDVRALRDDD